MPQDAKRARVAFQPTGQGSIRKELTAKRPAVPEQQALPSEATAQRPKINHQGGRAKHSEEDKRATTNVQNGLVFFF